MRRVRALSEAEFRAEGGDAVARVFQDADALASAPFTHRIEKRLLLFETDYSFSPEEAQALASAARVVGDDGFYVTSLLIREEGKPNDWWVPLEDLGGYGVKAYEERREEAADPNLENALVSPSGRWGVLFSQLYTLVGGSEEFVATFLANYPTTKCYEPKRRVIPITPPEEQVYGFLADLRRSYDLDWYEWLPELLEHVFGRDGARRVRKEFERRERKKV